MKKIPILFFILAASCTEVVINDESDLMSLPEPKSGTLTVEEALKELSDFNESLYGNTDVKSSDRIAEIEVCKIPTTKRVSEEETLAYVVNYEDDKGFAVINADPFSIPIVARTESGHMDTQRLNNKILDLISDFQTKSEISTDNSIDNSSLEDFIYEIIAKTLTSTPRNSSDSREYIYEDWCDILKYGPLVTVKWNQTYPFNMKMESNDYWLTENYNYYRGYPPVGCGNVALGQILATIKKPSRAPGTNTTYDWNVLRSLSNYTNISNYLPGKTSYPFDTNPILRSKVEDLADFLYVISVLCKSNSTEDGTSSTTENTLETMKYLDISYFSNAEILSYESNSSNMISCIQAGKPVFCRGDRITDEDTKSIDDKKTAGHAWVVDGYTKRERDYTLITPDDLHHGTQTRYYFHINWGYCGKYDGYYDTDVFDMSQRVYIDDTIDTNPNTSLGNKAYTLNLKFIKY